MNIRILTIITAFIVNYADNISIKAQDSNSVIIGDQIWMSKNLDTDTFQNGDRISEAKTMEEWLLAGLEKQPAWCYYYGDPGIGRQFGKLYNWYAVNDSRGLAPKGWHIPSDEEWKVLSDFLGGETSAGIELKSKKGWVDNGSGKDSYNFAGLPAGLLYVTCRGSESEVGFNSQNYAAFWWTSSEYDAGWLGNYSAWTRTINHDGKNLNKLHYCKDSGLSVRCIKNLRLSRKELLDSICNYLTKSKTLNEIYQGYFPNIVWTDKDKEFEQFMIDTVSLTMQFHWQDVMGPGKATGEYERISFFFKNLNVIEWESKENEEVLVIGIKRYDYSGYGKYIAEFKNKDRGVDYFYSSDSQTSYYNYNIKFETSEMPPEKQKKLSNWLNQLIEIRDAGLKNNKE